MRNDPCLTNKTQVWDFDKGCTFKMVFPMDIYTSSWLIKNEVNKEAYVSLLGFHFTIIKRLLTKTEHTLAYFTYKGISKILMFFFKHTKHWWYDVKDAGFISSSVFPRVYRVTNFWNMPFWGITAIQSKTKSDILYIFLHMKESIK